MGLERKESRGHGNGETVAQDEIDTPAQSRSALDRSEMHGERRGNIVDRRDRLPDRRGRVVDRRGLFADRRQATEALYRAPLDADGQTQLTAWQECERQRIAADLHDSIGSSLCTIRLKLQEVVAQLRENASPAPIEALTDIVSNVGRSMDELRRIAMDLRPSVLDDLGIVATIGWLSREIEGSQPGIRVEKHIAVREEDVPAPLKTPIFRILQEGLNNALKHSGARLLRVRLGRDETELQLTIEDDGRGFEMWKVLQGLDISQHFGIANMRYRANSSGGKLSIKAAPNAGTVVTCTWPSTTR